MEDTLELINSAINDNNVIEDAAEAENDSIYYSVASYGADYSVDGIVSRLKKKQIVVPDFQRRYVWDIKKASRFIESLILGLPVPGIFLSRDSKNPSQMLIIDGQQRLKSLQYFYQGKIEDRVFKLTGVCKELEGACYDELSPDDQNRLDDAIIHATIIKQETPDEDDSSIYMVFERLNTGGMVLQPQEIRACIYYGEFNNLLNKLVETPAWRSLFAKQNPRMKEQELILRFFALYFGFSDYKKGLKSFLNSFMSKNRNLTIHREEELTQLFEQSISLLVDAKGKDLFRKGNAINAALFDSIMVGVSMRLAKGSMSVEECISIYDSLLSDQSFLDYTTGATADEKQLKGRIEFAIQSFKSHEP